MRTEDSKLEASPTTLEELKLCLPRAPDERARGKLGVAATPKTGFKCGFSSAAMPVGRHVTKLSKGNPYPTQIVRDKRGSPKTAEEHIRLQFRNPDNATETVGLAQNSALTLSSSLESIKED
ncbi:hypothetical protein H4Q26_003617 [Puccinia striiformis f. sp. tritici PST-130]|nr:hypothetical protein H4Q26_003617 [Puccinia striiformis f. sp. tritici PST-130]